MKRAAMLILLFAQLAAAQEILSDRIKGLRVYGSGPAGIPVAELQSQPITVEFDVNEAEPPDLKIRVLHCDRDWNVTQNGFLNDEMQNRSKAPLGYERAPDGVRFYRYHYVVRIPGITGIERLAYSGNYLFEILDERSTSVLGRGRFFVVEKLLPLTAKISNRSLPSGINPYNQVKKIEVGFTIPKAEGMSGETFFPLLLKVTDIYRNRQLYNPWRIDADDQDSDTFVDGFGTPALKFVNQNVPPGNSYRTIDLSDVTAYPEDRLLRSTKGADVGRFQMPPGSDHHGRSEVIAGSRYGDYVPFRFELASEEPQWEQVYVVGDFNAWRPAREWLMTYDAATQRYFCDVSLRRGVYDYQYVVGPNDWIAVEGNDWRTSNAYSAFVYYRDNRLGGYDRIIGFAQWVGTGGKESTSQ